MHGSCRGCNLFVLNEEDGSMVCEVLDGREALHQCPALAEFVMFEGIKLYGVNKPPERRSRLKSGRR